MKHLLKEIGLKITKWTEPAIRYQLAHYPALVRPGTSYGGWIVPDRFFTPDSVVYLAGAGLDISFDVALAEKFGCQVQVIDPTPRSAEHVSLLKKNISVGEKTPLETAEGGVYPDFRANTSQLIHFHQVGLWSEDTILRFFTPEKEEYISHSFVNLQRSEKFIEVPVRRLSSLMKDFGHQHIHLLKIDIEGSEYEVLQSILEDHLSIDVICVEYDETYRNNIDKNYISRIQGSISALEKAGYRVIAKEPDCNNFTFIHQRCL